MLALEFTRKLLKDLKAAPEQTSCQPIDYEQPNQTFKKLLTDRYSKTAIKQAESTAVAL